MNAAILNVGTELLLGEVVNTNATYLSRKLQQVGINVFFHLTVGDNPGRLKQTLDWLFQSMDLVICTGGLGPTRDDLTKEVVAEYFELPLELHVESERWLQQFFAQRQRTPSPSNRKQCFFPRGSTIFPNRNGTAPGCAVEMPGENGKPSRMVILLPGPPYELKPMFEDSVFPFLESRSPFRLATRNFFFTGIGESTLATELDDLIQSQKDVSIATYVSGGMVRLRLGILLSRGEDETLAFHSIETVIRERFSSYLVGVLSEATVESGLELETLVVHGLVQKGWTLSVAESCTGGMIVDRLVSLPGVSRVFRGAVVPYQLPMKQALLQVPEELVKSHGLYSQQVTLAMARNLQKLTKSEVCLATNGIAGPSGGEKDHPVGTILVAICSPKGEVCERFQFSGDRATVRKHATVASFQMLRKLLET
ncbi:MAG TPA: competence/damage-inducible protein A [Thermotogota bacterium]|nr:competence/damage-inducible protein A [Thermotogota bacterium]HRW93462.1 competence/damage-inducible protein A [Thermotogota bacterium]